MNTPASFGQTLPLVILLLSRLLMYGMTITPCSKLSGLNIAHLAKSYTPHVLLRVSHSSHASGSESRLSRSRYFLSIVRFYISKFVDIMDGQFNTCTKSIAYQNWNYLRHELQMNTHGAFYRHSNFKLPAESQKLWERESLDKLSPTCRRHLLELNSRR